MVAHLPGTLSFAATAAALFALGFIIQTRGPEGWVHGVLDWSRLSEPDKRAAGRFTGYVLYAMGLVLLGRAAVAYYLGSMAPDARVFHLAVPVILVALAALLVGGLLPYRKRYRDRAKHLHER